MVEPGSTSRNSVVGWLVLEATFGVHTYQILHCRHPELRPEARVSLSLTALTEVGLPCAVQRIRPAFSRAHRKTSTSTRHISRSASPFPLCYFDIYFGSHVVSHSDSQAHSCRSLVVQFASYIDKLSPNISSAYSTEALANRGRSTGSYTRAHEHNDGCYQRWCRRRHKGTMRAFRVVWYVLRARIKEVYKLTCGRAIALFIQGALGALALLSLVWKRSRENPQRPLLIWFVDFGLSSDLRSAYC